MDSSTQPEFDNFLWSSSMLEAVDSYTGDERSKTYGGSASAPETLGSYDETVPDKTAKSASLPATLELDNTVVLENDNVNLEGSSISTTTSVKKKRKVEGNTAPIHVIGEVFLRIIYPLTLGMEKNVVVGIFKSLNYQAGVLLTHANKSILFTTNAWDSFKTSINLIRCYVSHNMYGKKTSVRLSDSDIEVDIVKSRNAQCGGFRDLTNYDSKVGLTTEEFFMLLNATPAVIRYIDQLEHCGSVIKDYLESGIDNQPNSPIIYGAVDTGIYNRLPHELCMYRNSFGLYKLQPAEDIPPIDSVDVHVKEEREDDSEGERPTETEV